MTRCARIGAGAGMASSDHRQPPVGRLASGRVSGRTPPALPARWSRAARPLFVGRRAELECLEAPWDEVTGGARQVAFVGGEPGAGKSRLLAEFCTVLHSRGATVLLGTCAAELG